MVDKADPPGRGWFDIKGTQTGARTLAEQLKGLEPLDGVVRGKSILDLGCAEGLVGLRLMEHGATSLIGLESSSSRVATAQAIAKRHKYPAIFRVVDLENLEGYAIANLPPSVGVVLALSIAHKLREPDRFLRAAAKLASNLLAVRLPRPTIRDARSGNRPIDVTLLLGAAGMGRWYEAPGPRGEWVGVFSREPRRPVFSCPRSGLYCDWYACRPDLCAALTLD